jgi:hypothetical protein
LGIWRWRAREPRQGIRAFPDIEPPSATPTNECRARSAVLIQQTIVVALTRVLTTKN